jgi:hypothetical protein
MSTPNSPGAEPFFEPLPEPQRVQDQPRVYVQLPWQPPVNVVPVSVGGTVELGRTGDTVVAMAALEVYPAGVAFTVHTWQRPGTEPQDEPHWAPHDRPRIGILLEDGTKIGASRDEPPQDLNSVPEVPRLLELSGTGGGIHEVMQWWLYPLPVSAHWSFVLEWLARGIPETRVAFDAGPLHAAAAASAGPLWELPTPPEGAEYGWFGYAG